MIRTCSFILLSIAVSIPILAQDTIAISNRLFNNLNTINTLSTAGDYNPAAKVFSKELSLSELFLGYNNLSGDASLTQKASSYNDYRFEAQSYLAMGAHHVWGKASYNNQTSDNIKWNESSDYENIYPYVYADTIGGNNLHGEKYSFLGGYGNQGEKLSFGVSLSYWALMEYRKIDPRPNNNTSNLKIDLGANYRLFHNYSIGAGGFIRKYKQTNTIKFGNVLGRKTSLHHMTGFGNEAFLFSNSEKDSMFDGHGYGANLQVLSSDKTGFDATVGYEYFSFEKQVKSDQNQILPLALVHEDKWVSQIVYSANRGKNRLAAKIDATYTNRKGTENKFTKDGNGAFVKIASDEAYYNKLTDIKLTLILQHQSANIVWSIQPQLAYYKKQEKHKTSSNELNISRFSFAATPGTLIKLGENILQLELTLGYSKNIDANISINNLTANKTLYQSLMSDYNYLSSDIFNGRFSARFDYNLDNTKVGLFIKGLIDYSKYHDAHSSFLAFNVGVVF